MRWIVWMALAGCSTDEPAATVGDTAPEQTWECPPGERYRLVAEVCGEEVVDVADEWRELVFHQPCGGLVVEQVDTDVSRLLHFRSAAPGGEVEELTIYVPGVDPEVTAEGTWDVSPASGDEPEGMTIRGHEPHDFHGCDDGIAPTLVYHRVE